MAPWVVELASREWPFKEEVQVVEGLLQAPMLSRWFQWLVEDSLAC